LRAGLGVLSSRGESNGTGKACAGATIQQIWYDCSGMTVDILWDASSDVICWTLSGYGFYDFRQAGPLTNNASSPTGDINFTTTGDDSGDRYTIMLALRKSY